MKVERPSTDSVIEAYKKDIDRTLLRENLKLTVEERLINLQQFLGFVEELQTSAATSQKAASTRQRA